MWGRAAAVRSGRATMAVCGPGRRRTGPATRSRRPTGRAPPDLDRVRRHGCRGLPRLRRRLHHAVHPRHAPRRALAGRDAELADGRGAGAGRRVRTPVPARPASGGRPCTQRPCGSFARCVGARGGPLAAPTRDLEHGTDKAAGASPIGPPGARRRGGGCTPTRGRVHADADGKRTPGRETAPGAGHPGTTPPPNEWSVRPCPPRRAAPRRAPRAGGPRRLAPARA